MSRRHSQDTPLVTLDIESIDLEAQGVTRHDGKVIFVRDALPRERVTARVVRRKPRFEVADTVEVLRSSAARVTPRCPNFGVCGGCSMQHLEERSQVAVKQRALEDQLWHLGRVRPGMILRPVSGSPWGYRFRARLSVRHVARKGGVLVGFHERGSSYVADMRECAVLPARVSDLLVPLRGLIESLDMMTRMPQIEVALGKRGSELVLAMVFRVLEPASEADRERLIAFAREHDFELWFQHKGPDTITLEWAPQGESRLAYELPEFGITMPYRPTDFTQVNHGINEVLVSRALRLLETAPGERVADLFCGLGNFTLPLARTAADVVGIEGSGTLVQRALENARRNGVEAHTRFEVRNLFTMTPEAWQALGPFDRVLIDPPREGALEVCKSIAFSPVRPKRIVYVSCNPATLARDAGVLVGVGGWTLRSAGVVNMFPNTSHVESIAVFDPPPADFVASLTPADEIPA